MPYVRSHVLDIFLFAGFFLSFLKVVENGLKSGYLGPNLRSKKCRVETYKHFTELLHVAEPLLIATTTKHRNIIMQVPQTIGVPLYCPNHHQVVFAP